VREKQLTVLRLRWSLYAAIDIERRKFSKLMVTENREAPLPRVCRGSIVGSKRPFKGRVAIDLLPSLIRLSGLIVGFSSFGLSQ